MSLIKLQGNASGTGAFTIAAPNGNSDRTLTLPDATGTVVTANGSGNIATTSITPSAGIYLGGSGSANLLDDYEEGTWTPTFTNITGAASAAANYTKVGQVVVFQLTFTCTAAPTANSSRFSLPFTSNQITPGGYTRSTSEGGELEVQGSGATCYFAKTASTSGTFYCTGTYRTPD